MLGVRAAVELPFVTACGEVSHGEKMLSSGTDPESYITEYTLVYEDTVWLQGSALKKGSALNMHAFIYIQM